MAHDGKTQREATERPLGAGARERTEPAMPTLGGPADAAGGPAPFPMSGLGALKPGNRDSSNNANNGADRGGRRPAKRRPAGPARPKIAANDDAPSIGGLIYSLQQKPSNRPFQVAAGASAVWFVIGIVFAWAMLASDGSSPMLLAVAATVLLPIALFWFLALLAWRTQELKLMSSAMTEVAVRLAEPDRAAEQSAASLGQAVRRQVSFMNEAISRALGRAGELEALVHNEVAALEKSYGENEHKIKGLIQELVGERHALVSTTDKVAETLKSMGSEVPTLIEKLSQQQIKLAKIIEGAGQNLIALENKLATASGGLETALSNRTLQLQAVLDDYTVALDATLANRAEALDMQLVERTRALDAAFSERLALFDDSMLRSAAAIDNAVNEKARALTVAMEDHVRALSDTLGRQVGNIDHSMMTGIDAVRRTSDSITRQSLKAIEGLSNQADVLRGVSETLVHQISGVTSRFDNQGQSIVNAAGALEGATLRIDTTLQKRQAELNDTVQRLSGKAQQLDEVMRGYSATVEGTIADAEARAHRLIEQLAQGTTAHAHAAVNEVERLRQQTDAHSQAVVSAFERMRAQTDAQSQAVVAEFERLRAQADAQTMRAIEDMRSKMSGASQEVTRQAANLQLEQERLRAEADRLPIVTRESAEAMRSALNDQLRALEQLSSLTGRDRRDVTPPGPLAPGAPLSLTAAYAAQAGVPPHPHQHQSLQPQPPADGGERWSLGDLLARASHDEDGTVRAPLLDIEGIARSVDPTTASAIWSRFRAGQRGIMVRSIYTAEGRASFDEASERYGRDGDFRRTVDRFLTDFERLVRETEQKSPRAVHDHLVSAEGRVYLFLAHASGRLR
jgi:ABC-type transporter Mla subunit MlaD